MEWPILAGLSEADRRKLLATVARRRFGRGEVLFHQGDPGDTVHLIGSGQVAVRVLTPRGDVATLAMVGAGDTVGELSVLPGGYSRTATVVAVIQTETLSISRARLEIIRRENVTVDHFFLELLARRIQSLDALLAEALFLPAETRVIRRLVEIAALGGSIGAAAMVNLTQDDLASLAGTSRETVNRVLGVAEKAQLLKRHRGRIEMLNVRELHRMAKLTPL